MVYSEWVFLLMALEMANKIPKGEPSKVAAKGGTVLAPGISDNREAQVGGSMQITSDF